jgi:hypothetical protein
MVEQTHPFTRSGLGLAPFSVYVPVKGEISDRNVHSCEHCGRPIKKLNLVQSSDGQISMVGIDCLKKTGDEGLIDGVRRLSGKVSAREKENKVRGEAISRERVIFDGKTARECIAELEHRKKVVVSDFNKLLWDDFVFKMLEGEPTSMFTLNMLTNIRDLRGLSPNMQAAIKDMVIKKLSGGARRGSKKYKACADMGQCKMNDLMDLMHAPMLDIAGIDREIQVIRDKSLLQKDCG